MRRNKNKGISLIVLVITILVIIVLAGAVLLVVSKNNPLESANESVFKSDIKNFQSELNLKVVDEIGKGKDITKINIEGENSNWKEYIPSIEGKKNYKKILQIVEGKLYIKEDAIADEIKWAEEVGIEVKSKIPLSYNNPYIPSGFEYTEGTWNNGYVIKDSSLGNEFVWIPVSNIADFKRTAFKGEDITTTYTETVPNEIIASVQKYGGYYIARYEAGTTIPTANAASRNVSGIPTSKQGEMVWTYIDWNNSLANAKAMYNNDEIASDLIYGTMWDTACNWLVNSGNKTQAELLDSSNWGNYLNNTATGHGILQKTGFSEEWKANNIYDLAR